VRTEAQLQQIRKQSLLPPGGATQAAGAQPGGFLREKRRAHEHGRGRLHEQGTGVKDWASNNKRKNQENVERKRTLYSSPKRSAGIVWGCLVNDFEKKKMRLH